MARPTIYNEQILIDTREYIELCEDGEKVVKLPTIEGLAYHLKINKDTIYSWRKEKDKEEFSELIDELLAKQARELINKGLSGNYNSTIAKVLLAKHGYRDAQEVTGLDGKDLIPETMTGEEKEKLLTLLK